MRKQLLNSPSDNTPNISAPIAMDTSINSATPVTVVIDDQSGKNNNIVVQRIGRNIFTPITLSGTEGNGNGHGHGTQRTRYIIGILSNHPNRTFYFKEEYSYWAGWVITETGNDHL